MAPLRHAMGLVDGEQRDFAPFEQLDTSVSQQAFGGDIKQIELTTQKCLLDFSGVLPILSRIEKGRTHAKLGQRIDLVLHQRNER